MQRVVYQVQVHTYIRSPVGFKITVVILEIAVKNIIRTLIHIFTYTHSYLLPEFKKSLESVRKIDDLISPSNETVECVAMMCEI